jgi:hypothetical protein
MVEEEMDVPSILFCGEAVSELGLKMGPRKKITLSAAALADAYVSADVADSSISSQQ